MSEPAVAPESADVSDGTAPEAEGEGEWSYDAFISYETRSSGHAAERIDRGLRAITRRHKKGADFRIFRDRTTLRAGPLESDLVDKLKRARCLVVILHTQTVTSTWVSQEIATWLETVGSPERLFLVKIDPDLELVWDKDGQFEDPERLPEPLRRAFSSEQLCINLPPERFADAEAALAPLGAPLIGIEPEEFRLEEALFDQIRRRRLLIVIGLMAVLLVATLVAAVVAVRSRDRAERSRAEAVRSEQRALAQADAAEAVLAADDSPTLAIERAIRAAQRDDSPTVRSAMLAVSQSSRRLVRTLAYPEDDIGHPATDGAFDRDGAHFAAWGQGSTDESSFLRIWDVASGDVEFSGTVDAVILTDLTRLGPSVAIACTARGPVTLELDETAAEVTVLHPAFDSGDARCDVEAFAGGAVVSVGPHFELAGSELIAPMGYFVDGRGRASAVEGVNHMAVHPSAQHAVLTGAAGVFVVSPGGVDHVTDQPAEQVVFADRRGRFLVRLAESTWGIVTPGAGGHQLRTVTVTVGAVDVAPVLDFGEMVGEVAWIMPDGTVGWSGNGRSTRVAPLPDGRRTQGDDPTAIEPLADEGFVAVHGEAAAILRPPTGSLAARNAGIGPDWRVSPVLASPGQPAGAGQILDRCADSQAVMIAFPSRGGSQLVNGSGQTLDLADGRFRPNCSLVDVDTSLTSGSGGAGDQILVRANLVADKVVLSPATPAVAVLRAGRPIEILSTESDRALPTPWAIGQSFDATLVTAFGERDLRIMTEGDRSFLAVTGPDGEIERHPIEERGRIVTVRPDGRGAVVEKIAPPGQRQRWLVGGPDRTAVADACGEETTIRYVPAAGFTTSVTAAEALVPVVRLEDRRLIDCRNGRETDATDPGNLPEYEIGRTHGRIVSATYDGFVLTTWTRGEPGSIRSVPAPPVPSTLVSPSFDERGVVALIREPEGREMVVYRRTGERWRRSLTIVSGLDSVVDAELVDDGTLILVVSQGGGFELYDSVNGHRLAADTYPEGVSAPVLAVSARIQGDLLQVHLQTDAEITPSAVIEIPIGIEALSRQLCAIHQAPGCES